MIETAKHFAYLTDLCGNTFLTLDALRFICGEKLGNGQFRDVFNFEFMPGTVIKIDENGSSNIKEFEIWNCVKGTKNEKWFARCFFMSRGGHFLIQKKVRPIRNSDKLPKTLPNIFTDIKKENWGFIGKQLVCHDYQFLDRAVDCSFVTKQNVKWVSNA